MTRGTSVWLVLTIEALVLASAQPVRGAEIGTMLADYSITSWGKKDGLPAGTIRALAQDAEGYLWLGTDVGLIRFDGVRFLPWDSLGRTRLPQGPVQSLRVSRDGSLWIGFSGHGDISRVAGKFATNYGQAEGLPPSGVDALVEDNAGVIIAVSGGVLFRFLADRWEKWDPPRSGLPDGHVRTAYAGRSGDLFLVTTEGIFRRRQSSDRFQRVEGTEHDVLVQDVAEDALGHLWVTDRLFGFHIVAGPPLRPAAVANNGKGYRLLADRAGNLWIATFGQGLWRVRGDARPGSAFAERATDVTGLSNNTLSALLEDREGNIWVGTMEGLNRLTAHKFEQITGLGLVTGLDVTPDGSVWAGTSHGLLQLAPAGATFRPARTYMNGLPIRAMHADNDGTLWAASDNDLQQIANGVASSATARAAGKLRRIIAITSDAHGSTWVYDLDRGLLRSNRERFEPVRLPSELHHSQVVTMYTDRSGRMWLAFTQGLMAIIDRDGTIRSYGARDGLDVGILHSIYEDDAGTIWIVGRDGLCRFSNGRFITLLQGNGLPSHLTGIIQDNAGSLWFGSASEIVRMNPSEFDRAASGHWDQVNYNVYDASDGVTGTTDWFGQRNAIRAKDGRLWFLTNQGITIVDPRALHTSHAPAPVRVDDATVDGRKMAPDPRLRLPAGTTRLEINYTVPDLTSTLKTRFRYRLEGVDADWIDAGSRRQAVYTDLPPRQYQFRVQANNEDGKWARPSETWDFAIAPPLYQTPWFYGVVAVGLIGTAWLGWGFRMAQVRMGFALLLGERVRLSREIHDTLLQSLMGVQMQLDQLANDLQSPPQATRDQLVRIRRQIENYIREARQSIWNLRSSTLQRYDLPTALREAGERASENGVVFELQIAGAQRRCAPTVEEQLLRIGQEAVTNALRHGRAQRIDMALRYEDATISLRVSDDGAGFDPKTIGDAANGHYGMASMKERAAAIGGELLIVSAIGAGTVVETVMPVSPSV